MVKHCLTCGTKHEENDVCPAGAFVIITCKNCTEESILPGDALFGVSSMHCCCGAVGEYRIEQATEQSIKRVWPEYGQKGK